MPAYNKALRGAYKLGGTSAKGFGQGRAASSPHTTSVYTIGLTLPCIVGSTMPL